MREEHSEDFKERVLYFATTAQSASPKVLILLYKCVGVALQTQIDLWKLAPFRYFASLKYTLSPLKGMETTSGLYEAASDFVQFIEY